MRARKRKWSNLIIRAIIATILLLLTPIIVKDIERLEREKNPFFTEQQSEEDMTETERDLSGGLDLTVEGIERIFFITPVHAEEAVYKKAYTLEGVEESSYTIHIAYIGDPPGFFKEVTIEDENGSNTLSQNEISDWSFSAEVKGEALVKIKYKNSDEMDYFCIQPETE